MWFMQFNIYDLLNQWESIGVFDYLLPFLLIFAVVFAILETTKVLGEQKGIHKLAVLSIEDEFSKYSQNAEVEVVSDNKCIVYVPERDIAKIIGKQGKNISMIEKDLGMSVEVRELSERNSKEKTENKHEEREIEKKQEEVSYDLNVKKNSVTFQLDINMQNKDIDIYLGDEFLMTAKAGKTGLIKVKKNNNIGRVILKAINNGEKVKLFI